MVATEGTYEAEDKMGFVAAALTDRDQERPMEILCAARMAVSLLDPEDHETIAGYRVGPAEVRHWHEFTAGIVEPKRREESARRRASTGGKRGAGPIRRGRPGTSSSGTRRSTSPWKVSRPHGRSKNERS